MVSSHGPSKHADHRFVGAKRAAGANKFLSVEFYNGPSDSGDSFVSPLEYLVDSLAIYK